MSLEEHQAKIAAQKRAAILDAARALFKEDGYERTTTDKVARLAEVSSATVCKHFPTKEQLFGAVMQCLWAEGASLELPSPPPGDPRAGLTQLAQEDADFLMRPNARLQLAQMTSRGDGWSGTDRDTVRDLWR